MQAPTTYGKPGTFFEEKNQRKPGKVKDFLRLGSIKECEK